MKKQISKVFTALTVTFILFVVSACGNKTSAEAFSNETEIEESTIEETETIENKEETAENESSESEETEPIEIASGHQHNIDMEEKIKEIDTEEEEREEEVQTQTTATEKKEAEIKTATSESVPTATTAEQTASSVIGTVPDMSTLEEWVPAIPMTVVYTTQVKDSDGNNLGEILEGSSIGVSGKCGNGWYQVNYGAKRSFLPMDCLKQ